MENVSAITCKTSPESHCCLTESIRCIGRTGCGLSASWCPRTGEISHVLRDFYLSAVFSPPPYITASAAQNGIKAHTELTQSYGRSESEEEERRPPIREVSDSYTVYAWAALCWWVHESSSLMILYWSHPPGLDPAGTHCISVLNCLQQR